MQKNLYKRKFGCEFEYSTEFEDFASLAKRVIARIYGVGKIKIVEDWYKSDNNTKWDVKTDSTTLVELCTPVSRFRDIKNICNVIRSLSRNKSVLVTNNDSMHVHVDAHDIPKENILLLWLKYEKLIFSMFPRHRRVKNCYCKQSIENFPKSEKLIATFFKEALETTLDHHSAISFFFYKNNKKGRNTVEFRLGEGTTDPRFVRNWVLFLLYFLERCKNLETPFEAICDKTVKVNCRTLEEMIEDLDIDDKGVIEWLQERFITFNKNKYL